jgi:hypothetical protein
MSKANAEREDDRINIKNPEHVEYWTGEFGVTADTLIFLIEHHGNLASELRLILGK